MDDEIDLFELGGTLWKGRWIILACVMVCALAAVTYALLAPQQWTSTAQVSRPQLPQFGKYLEQRHAIVRVMSNKAAAPDEPFALPDDDKPLNARELAKLLFDNFITETAAARNKRDYLQDTDYFKAVTKDVKSQSGKNAALVSMTTQLKIQAPAKDQVTPYYIVSFSADTAKQAQEVLAGYLARTNTLALQEVDDEFRSQVNGRLLDWETEITNTKVQLEAYRKQQIDELRNALETAKEAGIQNYLVGREEAGNTIIDISNSSKAYMLGQKYLSAELDTTNEAPLVFPARYYQTRYKLEQTKPLLNYEAEAQTYSYVLPPTLSVHRDKPKRKLIVVAGVLVGGMIGGFWVLLADALRRRRAYDAAA